jgi:hypothetical protein
MHDLSAFAGEYGPLLNTFTDPTSWLKTDLPPRIWPIFDRQPAWLLAFQRLIFFIL